VKAETVKPILADIECQSADDDPEQRKRQDAGDKPDNEGREPKSEPDVGAMPQEGPDHPPSPY
jgi:hypothetical protein